MGGPVDSFIDSEQQEDVNSPTNMWRYFRNSEEIGPIDMKTNTPGSTKSTNPAAEALLRSALQYYQDTSGVRGNLINRSNNFLSGNLDVTQSPMYGAVKVASDQQYGRARDNILSTLPQGGSLSSALTQNELDKARYMATQTGALAQDELNRAMQIADPRLGFSGMGAAGQIQAAQAAARAQERSQLMSTKGEMWGGGMSGMAGK